MIKIPKLGKLSIPYPVFSVGLGGDGDLDKT